MEKRQVFILEIMDNQKDTWQGQLRWIDGKKESPFRSVLEMLHLIDSTLNGGTEETSDPMEMWQTGENNA